MSAMLRVLVRRGIRSCQYQRRRHGTTIRTSSAILLHASASASASTSTATHSSSQPHSHYTTTTAASQFPPPPPPQHTPPSLSSSLSCHARHIHTSTTLSTVVKPWSSSSSSSAAGAGAGATTTTATSSFACPVRLSQLRNVGIIAHIDAGKTTTTERMLYYAGLTRAVGDVDKGNTVTDFMREERERGITINGACITFPWKDNTINLVDTPGHVDFTVEVERAVRVLDGAVTIFDGVAGVQAQTETVWRQARRYKVPSVAFINKMDRDGADVYNTLRSMRKRLHVHRPLLLQLPVGQGTRFQAVVDTIEHTLITWDGQFGDTQTSSSLHNLSDQHKQLLNTINVDYDELVQDAYNARLHVVESLADVNDELADLYLDCDPDTDLGAMQAISAEIIHEAIRTATIQMKVVPVLCGAAFRNVGVQPLMDALLRYLPSPMDRPAVEAFDDAGQTVLVRPDNPDKAAIALAFKVQHERARGAVVFLRVFSGSVRVREQLINTTHFVDDQGTAGPEVPRSVSAAHLAEAGASSAAAATAAAAASSAASSSAASLSSPSSTTAGTTGGRRKLLPHEHRRRSQFVKERAMRLLRVAADRWEEVDTLNAGEIGAVTGFRYTRTGDTLTSALDRRHLQLAGIHIPEPVFFCAIEAESTKDEQALSDALDKLQLEDPSVQVTVDEDTGQTLLKGMGELHLEIAAHRLQRDFKVPCELGKVRIAYRETVTVPSEVEHTYENVHINPPAFANVTISLEPIDPTTSGEEVKATSDGIAPQPLENQVDIRLRPPRIGSREDTPVVPRLFREALVRGVNDALSRGVLLGYPVLGVHATIVGVSDPAQSSPDAFRVCAMQATSEALRHSEPSFLEPIMDLTVEADTEHVGSVLSDLTSKRRGHVMQTYSGTIVSESEDIDDMTIPENSVDDDDRSHVLAEVPLSEMIGYASALRSATRGSGSFVMQFNEYRLVGSQAHKQIIDNPE
jgi:elongation factor G